MIVSLFELSRTYKFLVMFLLVAVSAYVTFYYHHVLGTGTIFTHFFYIPIVLACIWWKKRGLVVVILLSGILLGSHTLFRGTETYVNNLMRIIIFFLVAAVSILLSQGIASARQRAEENRKWYETLFQTARTALFILGDDAVIDLANVECEALTGFRKDELENARTLFDLLPNGQKRKASVYYYHIKKGKFYRYNFVEVRLRKKDGKERDIRLALTLIPHTSKIIASLHDLTEWKAAMEEQKRLKTELGKILSKVLSGYLPICAWCKRIRDEAGKWNSLESYIHEHTEADFTHTICPDCARELYPDLIDDIEEETHLPIQSRPDSPPKA